MDQAIVGDLLAELRADQQTPGVGCATCKFIARQPDAKAWWAATMDRSFTLASLSRAAAKRGAKIGDAAFRGHRQKGHKP